MILRAATVSVLALATVLIAGDAPDHDRLLRRFLAGDEATWYGVYVDQRRVGWVMIEHVRSERGWEIRTRGALALTTSTRRIRNDRVFAAHPPFKLQRRAPRQGEARPPAARAYQLSDALALGRQLVQEPSPGTGVSLHRSSLGARPVRETAWRVERTLGPRVRRRYQLQAANGTEYALVDAAGVPLVYRSGDVFELVREPARTARSLDGALPGNEQLRAHVSPLGIARREVRSMTLRVSGPRAESLPNGPGQQVRAVDSGARIVRTGRRAANTSNQDEQRSRHLATTAAYPADLPSIQRLAAEADTGSQARIATIDALLQTVQRRLDYDPQAKSLHVQALLVRGRADCTGYATLFTTLARAAGISARNVAGMVYTPDPQPAFALHTWSEVWLEGHWRAVDPTFGQQRVDGTHVRFPDAPAAQLELALALPELTLRVEALERK